MNNFLQQGCIKLIKSDSEDCHFLFVKESCCCNKCHSFHKNIKQHNRF